MNSPFEKRICFTVCICQLTAVLSCVSVVYLTVAVYSPAYKILNSDFSEKPVMCTTIANRTPDDCDSELGIGGGGGWNSCSEWCLSKSSGSCPRIMVDVRRNGSNLRLEECDAVETIWCHGIDPNEKQHECYKGECAAMNGLLNCTNPTAQPGAQISADGGYGTRCRDLSLILDCTIVNTDNPIHCQGPRNCLSIQGLYKCQVGDCSKVLPPYNCKKRCVGIRTGEKSIIIRQGDIIFSANCGKLVDVDTGKEMWPLGKMSKTRPDLPMTLLMACTDLAPDKGSNGTYQLTDCFNGTLIEPDTFGWNTTIDILQQTHLDAVERALSERDINADDHSLIGNAELDLLIHNNTRLYINYESCVNTLILSECEKFYEKYGGDGTDLRTNSRFPCFHSPTSRLFVVLRFSRWFYKFSSISMVGAAGLVANAVNNSRQRRESRASRRGSDDNNNEGRLGSRATIADILNSRHILASGAVGGGGGLGGSQLSQKSKKSMAHQHLHPIVRDKNQPHEIPPEKMTMAEQIKFYISLTLGIIATLCVFALLFLIPLVVEPSISTLFADFDSEPATCVTTRAEEVTGLTKCGIYSSCKEGCTTTPHRCIQINVNYRKANKPGYRPMKNFTFVDPHELSDDSHWDAVYTQLFINAKGCGYPPKVICEDFKATYGKVGIVYPCYYSRENPRLVVIDYNWEETAYPLIFSLGIPTGLFTVSIAVLSVWYCPSCEERGKNKRPCRSRYAIARPSPEDVVHRDRPLKKSDKESINNKKAQQNNQAQPPPPPPRPDPQPIIQQPRRKHSLYRPNSPSLATISSGDTATSSMSVNSLDSNLSVRTRKL